MKFTSIYDTLWTDAGFKQLSTNGKLLFLCIMSSPLFGFGGVCYATIGLLSEYSGLSRAESEKALKELVEIGAIIQCGDYLIIKNYLLFNKMNGEPIRIKLINDFNALPKDVFACVMSIGICKSVYVRCCELQKREIREPLEIEWIEQPLQIEHQQAKPKPKPEPVTESEEIQRLRGYVAAIIADFPDSKNSKNELTADQYQKLIDKYGYSKLVVMQRIYFEWKVSRKEKTKTTDFGTLNKGDGWVVTEADKHEPEPEQPIEEPWVRPEWKYTYPKPDNYETMDQRQINVYLVACAKEQNALETAKYIETCMAKSAQEAKEAAEQAELMRWKYPFPKPEFWDGMSEPARASYIRRNTLPEDVAK